jgi:hypothetical protein
MSAVAEASFLGLASDKFRRALPKKNAGAVRKDATADLLGEWSTKLTRLTGLAVGWNGYDAAPPSEIAIQATRNYLSALRAAQWTPDRLEPSAMGGVGVTHRRGERKVYVEFYNDGRVHALFSERGDPPRMTTQPLEPGSTAFAAFIRTARSYLDG